MSEYHDQRNELVRLKLYIGPCSGSLLAMQCESQARQKDIAKARQAYLEEHGPEKIKAKFPKAYFLCWPGL